MKLNMFSILENLNEHPLMIFTHVPQALFSSGCIFLNGRPQLNTTNCPQKAENLSGSCSHSKRTLESIRVHCCEALVPVACQSVTIFPRTLGIFESPAPRSVGMRMRSKTEGLKIKVLKT